jgi:uncharacterized protein with GYD domain
MPTYVFLSKWTDQGARNPKELLAWSDQNRAAAEQRGGVPNVIGLWCKPRQNLVDAGLHSL